MHGAGDSKKMASVLMVDDNLDTLELSVELVESAGHRVQTGHNGEEGLRSLAAGPLPDCVVLDVDMPVLSGPGMAHQMLLHDAGEEKIPIVLVSGRDDLSEVARRIGTPYFLAKGISDYGKALLELLARALGERLAPASARTRRENRARTQAPSRASFVSGITGPESSRSDS